MILSYNHFTHITHMIAASNTVGLIDDVTN